MLSSDGVVIASLGGALAILVGSAGMCVVDGIRFAARTEDKGHSVQVRCHCDHAGCCGWRMVRMSVQPGAG